LVNGKLQKGNRQELKEFKNTKKRNNDLSPFGWLIFPYMLSGRISFALRILLLVTLLFPPVTVLSQQKKRVDIEQADYLEADDKIAANAQRLVGNVRIRHEDVLMWCDSAYTYTGTNRVDAFGNVHINQGDTLNLYAQKIYYNGDIKFASAFRDVKLVNKNTTLYTDTLDYDMAANIGYYENHGKIVDSINILTSIIGKYFIDTDLIHFYQDVNAYNDNYTLTGDTLVYNTQNGRILIIGPTTIRDSSNTLYAEDGWYDTRTGEAELLKNPLVYNEEQRMTAGYIKYNETEGNGKALDNVRMEDLKNKAIVLGNTAFFHDKKETATVTDSALLLIYSDKDTLYLHADTLRTVPDTIAGEKLFMTYYGTRFFRTDLQGICDSLVYFTRDSLVQLFRNPVIWSEGHQMTADFIEMKQNTEAPDELRLKDNSFIISKLDSGRFDQIKGRNMIGYVINNELNKIDVDGNGQTLYYARQEEEIIGLNRVESSRISLRFREGKIFRISFLQAPDGLLKPLFSLTEEEKTLSGFDWKIHLRPLSKQDVFPREEQNTEAEKTITSALPEINHKLKGKNQTK
jgi:lipopolysaccharide export system protein LptA